MTTSPSAPNAASASMDRNSRHSLLAFRLRVTFASTPSARFVPALPGPLRTFSRTVRPPRPVKGDRQADDEIRSQVARGVRDATDRMVDALNTVEPAIAEARQNLAKAAERNPGQDMQFISMAISP